MGVFRYTLMILVAALALAPAALGQAGAGYGPPAANVQSQVQKSATGRTGVAGLPFTGLDLALIVGGGLVLVLAGGTIRRASARRA